MLKIMNNCELVSIIMPCYNAEKFISFSIESVLKQTYRNWELIIVDDYSSDKSVELVRQFNDSRIKLFINEENLGAALSRNKALKEAKGKWIAFLDADDIWLETKLEEQINFMKINKISFSYTDYRLSNNGNLTNKIITAPNVIDFKKIKKYCYIATLTVMYDQTVTGLIQIGDIKKNNDYALWLKILQIIDGKRYPKCLSIYNKHEGSISNISKIKLIKWHYILFKQEFGYSKIKSIFLTIGNLWYGFWKKIFYKKKIKNE